MNSNDIMSGGKVYAFFFGFKLNLLGDELVSGLIAMAVG